MSDHDADRELLETLARGLGAAEPVPARASDAARAVFTWRTIDAELMEVGFDSVVDELTGVRSSGTTVRAIRFAAGDIEVDLDVDGGRVDGHVIGAVVAAVRLERPDGTALAVLVDDLGRFGFDDVAPGPVRFRIDADAGALVTQWFVI